MLPDKIVQLVGRIAPAGIAPALSLFGPSTIMAHQAPCPGAGSLLEPLVEQLISIAVFVGVGLVFVLFNLLIGAVVRPTFPNAEKASIYECGEPTIGPSWVQFDLRFYIVALFYLVFDVEVALTYPWAVVFRDYPTVAIAYGAPFVGIIVIGYAYEWYSGSLEWVRSNVNTTYVNPNDALSVLARRDELSKIARRDPEMIDAGSSH